MSKLAWLTPDQSEFTEPDDCRVIEIPGNLWSLVNGALLTLTESHNWEEFGDATPEETANFFQNIFDNYLVSACMYIGELRPFVNDALPDKWLPMDNTFYEVGDYPELSALLPSGWVGFPTANDFILPTMSGRTIIGKGTLQGRTFTEGISQGQHGVTLTVNQIPAHSHSYVPPVADIDLELAGVPDVAAARLGVPIQTGSEGGGQSHDNMSPSMPLTWGIYAGR